MPLVDAPNRTNAIDRGPVIQVARKRVARVGGNRADTAMIQNLRCLPQQSNLRIDRMY